MYNYFSNIWIFLLFAELLIGAAGLVWILWKQRIVKQKMEFGTMRFLWILLMLTTFFLYSSQAAEIYVDDVASNGNGTLNSPFNSISSALNAANPGDIIRVLPGNYAQKITSQISGTSGSPITIRAHDAGNRPVFSISGTVMKISHDNIVIDGIVLDAQFSGNDIVRIDNADNLTIRNSEIRNATKDGIDMEQSNNVLIENTKIHHCLAGTINSQQDAHGIVAVTSTNITIRDCEIFYVSGDCFQADPSRGTPVWDNVLIENSKLWTGPLPADAAGWNAGEVPGENAIDTKVNGSSGNANYRAKLTLRHVEAFGFVPGYISNRAAFNIKEKVDCFMDGVTAHNNEIGFRLRGPGSNGGAHITIINSIAYDNETAFRTEDDLEKLLIYNSTFDIGTGNRYFQNAGGGYDPAGFDLRNSLFLGTKPGDASEPSNLSANASFFVNRSSNDYRLSSSSPAINAGETIAIVTHDFAGNSRTAGQYDVGAFEGNPATGIDDDAAPLEGFRLQQNYPNPFNPETTIEFTMASAGRVTLEIFDVLGRKVRTLVSDFLPSGSYSQRWNGRNDVGDLVESGVYVYRLQAGNFSRIRKMQLIQ